MTEGSKIILVGWMVIMGLFCIGVVLRAEWERRHSK